MFLTKTKKSSSFYSSQNFNRNLSLATTLKTLHAFAFRAFLLLPDGFTIYVRCTHMAQCGFKQRFFTKVSFESKRKRADVLVSKNKAVFAFFFFFFFLYVNLENEKYR